MAEIESTQKLMDEKSGDMANVIEGEETKIIKTYETDAFKIKVGRDSLNKFYEKIEKIQNKKLSPPEKEKRVQELIELWIQKKMKPKRIIKKGEFWHDFEVFQKTMFDGIEFKHSEQKKLGEKKEEKQK